MTAASRRVFERITGFDKRAYALACMAALAIGACLRAGWNLLRPTPGAYGEAENVAIALSQGLGFADAFKAGQGATAHVLPIPPMIAGGVYTLFGPREIVSEVILASWSIGLSLCSYLIYNHVFRQLRVPAEARLAAVSFLSVVPVFIAQEAVDFRVWDGGLAVVLAATTLLCALRSPSLACIAAAALGLLAFVNPLLAAGTLVGVLFLAWSWPWRTKIVSGTILFAVVFALFGTWAARNNRDLGSPILLRSNGGIELAIGMNPHMLDSTDPRSSFEKRMIEVHPYLNPQAYAVVKANNERAWATKVGDETFQWMKSNPSAAAFLMLSHAKSLIFPEPWVFTLIGNPVGATTRSIIVSLVSGFGLIGLFYFVRKDRRWVSLLAVALIPTVLYMPFQPVPRYLYIFYAVYAFGAAALLQLCFVRWRGLAA